MKILHGFYNFDDRCLLFISGGPRDVPNHIEKKFRKKSNYSLSYGYQHPQEHDGVEGKYVFEAGDLVD